MTEFTKRYARIWVLRAVIFSSPIGRYVIDHLHASHSAELSRAIANELNTLAIHTTIAAKEARSSIFIRWLASRTAVKLFEMEKEAERMAEYAEVTRDGDVSPFSTQFSEMAAMYKQMREEV